MPSSIIKQEYCDLAFETQRLLEKVVISLVKKYSQETGIKKICLAGGVAMNCKMNGAILHESEIEDIYIFPVPYDAGTALGSALILSQELGFSPRKIRINHPYWGPEYDCNTIKNVLNSMKLNYVESSDIVSDVVRELTSDQFVSWFQGQAEIGARALGARSILANPSSLKIKDRLNQEVKKREVFRPFAPSFLKEYQFEYIQNVKDSEFMLLAFRIKPEKKSSIEGVVHVDDTVRLQSVTEQSNKLYYDLIYQFYHETKIPALLNTSFNIRGEPIVNTPLDAIRCFYGSGLDVLVLGSFIIYKKDRH